MGTKLALAAVIACSLQAAERAPRHYQARLLMPITSEAHAGAEVSARLIGPVDRRREGALPAGTVVHGNVRRAKSVRFGVVRERAEVELSFSRCALATGEAYDCAAQLTDVDNAREGVPRPDVIRGIVAASHPHSLVSGVWFKPAPTLFGKSALGLTGAGGAIQSQLFPNPVLAAAMVGARLIFFRLPESEIILPVGTDVILRIQHPATTEPALDVPETDALKECPLRDEVIMQPAEVTQPNRGRTTDLINFAMDGTLEDLQQAFAAAGWSIAEPLTARSFARMYAAFASMKTYSSAPVSPMHYRGRMPEVVFQKSFNTLARRHHIRLWQVEIQGQTLWLGAATHDTEIAMDWRKLSFTHRVDVRIDRERNMILNDLSDAGCLAQSVLVDRSWLQSAFSDRRVRTTDGAIALVHLKPCGPARAAAEPVKRPHCRRMRAVVRRLVLESRHYVTRGNPYYYGYRAIRWSLARGIPGDSVE